MADFLLLWLFLLVLIVACAFLLGGHGHMERPTIRERGTSGLMRALPWRLSLTDAMWAIGFLLFLALYVFLIFYKADFTYYDDDQFTEFSLQGKDFAPPIWPNVGRFFPLAEQEFNLLRFVTRSAAGYHSFAIAQLIILLSALFVILRDFKIRYRVPILIAVMLVPSFVIVFTGLIYPERNILFWLAIVVLCLRGYSKSKAPIYFVGCLVATHFALYYKEIVVLFVVGYALTRLTLEFGARPPGVHRFWRETAKENSLSLGMLAITGIYAALFLIAMISHRNFSYIAEHREALSSVLQSCLQLDWLPLILFVVLILRVGRSILFGSQLDPLWDSLGVGALAYLFGILALRLSSGYYLAPVDLIALLYLASMSFVWLSKPTRTRISVIIVIFTLTLLHNVAYSSFRIVEMKNVVAMKSQLAAFLRSYQTTATGDPVVVFFPFASGYNLMGLSSYLRYQGFHLNGQTGTGPRLVIEGHESFANGRCVKYRDYSCTHAESAAAGALIVVLPDDVASMREVEKVSKDATLLLSLRACAVCTQTDSWFRLLHGISPQFSNRELPEHWLQLHVFEQRK